VGITLRIGVVFLLALALEGCESKAAERIYVPGVFGADEYGLRYKPTKIVYTGDGSSYVDHLRYRSYGGPRAIADGIDQVNDCEPSCGGGTYHPVRARVTFWHLATCRGKRIYAMFKIYAPDARRYSKTNPFTVDLRYMAACPVSDLMPPVIVEHFTLLRCPAEPTSTLDFEGCAEHRILESNEAINKQVLVIFGRLASAASRRRFVRSERAWLAYRRAICESRADVYEGGSAAVIVFAKCVANRNLAHLKDLRAFERDLRPK
jgi:uncharacterized protein YecT (DUF1311 family)